MSGAQQHEPAAAGGSWISASVEETGRAGAALARELREGDVIALQGPLGAGKTRFVAGIARGLGWRGEVRSPTFTLVNEYRGRVALFHADLYRVDTDEVGDLGLEECLERGALVVEWGEKLPPSLVEEALEVGMEPLSEHERSIAARAAGPRGLELLAAWERAVAEVSGAPSPGAKARGGTPRRAVVP
jgi:tRNA threonylcarbamoyladenosine biosynthesis protein TsaE